MDILDWNPETTDFLVEQLVSESFDDEFYTCMVMLVYQLIIV